MCDDGVQMRHFGAYAPNLEALPVPPKFSRGERGTGKKLVQGPAAREGVKILFSSWNLETVPPDENFENAPSEPPKWATIAPLLGKDASLILQNAPEFLEFYCIFINKSGQN